MKNRRIVTLIILITASIVVIVFEKAVLLIPLHVLEDQLYYAILINYLLALLVLKIKDGISFSIAIAATAIAGVLYTLFWIELSEFIMRIAYVFWIVGAMQYIAFQVFAKKKRLA